MVWFMDVAFVDYQLSKEPAMHFWSVGKLKLAMITSLKTLLHVLRQTCKMLWVKTGFAWHLVFSTAMMVQQKTLN